jgi:prepilin-type N-terminal cleavage/methylation domain-containing protein
MRKGLTFVEVLIALAVLGIAFGALLMSQVSNLRANAQARFATDAKAAAVQVLEKLSAGVLKSEVVPATSPYKDAPLDPNNPSGNWRSFYFVDYYFSCPTLVAPSPKQRGGLVANLRPGLPCSGTETVGGIPVAWNVRGEGGTLGEGVVTVVVTATHPRGPKVTMGRRVTCYDVYPSPTQDQPAPCPPPGGCRP